MPKPAQTPLTLKILGVAIAFIQVFDTLIHAATNQLEPLRVSSNVIILVWLVVAATGKLSAKCLPTAAIGVYVVLNVIFVALEGVTNDGQLRVMLLLLVAVTVSLSTLLAYWLGRHK